MLEHTFIHLPNLGSRRECWLWQNGIRTWDDFLEHYAADPYQEQRCTVVASSKYALKLGDGEYFASVLPSSETWRALPHFKRIAYLDIETTGLAPATDHLTVVGVYDGYNNKIHSYVHGKNLDQFADDITQYDAVVTFNGSRFDLPFIRKSIPSVELPSLHVDLFFLLASLGVRGGLKRIEAQFGLERESDLKGLTGYDAVLLWQKYKKHNDPAALDKLVRYNAADISNLQFLAGWAYDEKRKRTNIDSL